MTSIAAVSVLQMNNTDYKNSIHGYRPDIDGLRALAVLAVVAYHAYPTSFKGGFVGVDIFFVISGFLICGIILNSLENDAFTIKGFYQRRICRLFPALTTVLLATIAFGWFSLLADEFAGLGKHTAGGAGFVANLILWQEVGYWDIAAQLKPLLHLWSLGIEEQFYIIFPCMLFVARKKGVRPAALIAVMLIASFVSSTHYSGDPTLNFYAPHTRFWELLVGALLAASARNDNQGLRRIMLGNDRLLLKNILSSLGFVLLFLAMRFCRVDGNHFSVYALLPVAGTALVIAAGPSAWLNRRILSNKVAVGVGLVSYPLYLWHWPILSYFHILGWEASGLWSWRLIRLGCILCAILLAFLTYKYIEIPVRFKAKKVHKKTLLLASAMCLIGISGAGIYLNNGFQNRFPVIDKKILFGSGHIDTLNFTSEDSEAANRYYPKIKNKNSAWYRDVGSKTTVAIIGDSHARVAYFGMAEKNAELGINTFCISYPLLDSDENFVDRQIIMDIFSKNDIKYVFIFYRGVWYLTGTDIDQPLHRRASGKNLYDKFAPFLQELIDTIVSMNKQVLLVSENPVLAYDPQKYIFKRRFSFEKPLSPKKQEVLEHQRDYLALLDKLHGATIIKSIDTFCPQDRCLDFLSDGQVLYSDDDHLSISGSRFQSAELLSPYLERIAKQSKPSANE